ncbi:MAG: hypothetical protein PHY08_08775 [Candidatus Cloacimonetes bacterium]|nr:hypothetical protein [Candidatus Cloacimonadota bacterium]
MPFNRFIIFQIIFSVVFFSVLFFANFFFIDFIKQIDEQKSIYPILIYANSQKEINQIKDFAESSEIIKTYKMTTPDSLEQSILKKYNLTEYSKIANSYRLPYQLELIVQPVSYENLTKFYNALIKNFPEYIIQKNENVWAEIELKVSLLYKVLYVIKLLILIAYVFFMIFFRMIFIGINRDRLLAIYKSGIQLKRLLKLQRLFSFYFIIISFCMALMIESIWSYSNFNEIVIDKEIQLMFIFANLIVIFFQKSLFKKKR